MTLNLRNLPVEKNSIVPFLMKIIQKTYVVLLLLVILSTIWGCQKIFDSQTVPATDIDFLSLDNVISEFPLKENNLAVFPYINLPENTQFTTSPLIKEEDMVYIPYRKDLIRVHGTSFKTFIDRTENKEWSEENFIKNIEQQILNYGGVLLFKGNLAPDLVDFLKKQNYMAGEEGSIDFETEKIYTYGIFLKEGQHVLIIFTANKRSGALQIIQNNISK